MNSPRILKAFAMVCAIVFALASCRPEADVEPRDQNAPGIALAGDTIHTRPSPVCTTVASGNLVDALGRTGSGNIFGADWRSSIIIKG